MPDPTRQHVVVGTAEDGRTVYWTAGRGARSPEFLRDKTYAYPMTLEGAREVATRFNVSNTGLAGFRFDTERYSLA